MKYITIAIILLLLCLSFPIYCQTGILASGGDGLGENGTFSFSIGQINYSYLDAGAIQVEEGLQHAYEIIEITTPGQTPRPLVNAILYPNPTTDLIHMEIQEGLATGLTYKLMDIRGRILKSGPMEGPITTISLLPYETATYFLHIANGKTSLQGFKIIKN